MGNPKVSFIIPVYNVENFLPICLESIKNQTVDDLEIICVNDCSQDSSKNIIEQFAAKDKRFVLIDFNENMGPGAARNAGLAAASGEFTRMVDSDDYVPRDSTEKMLNEAVKNNSDYVKGGFRICDVSGKVGGKGWRYPEEYVVNTSTKEDRRLWYLDQHCTYLFRTSILNASGVRYDESMKNGQDSAFMSDLLPHLKKVTIFPETVYYYRVNPSSIMRQKRGKDFYFNVFGLYRRAYQHVEYFGTKEPSDYILFLALCYYLPNNIFYSIPKDLNYENSIEVLNFFRDILIEFEGKGLCINHQYEWQKTIRMPFFSKYIAIMLNDGFVDDVYRDLLENSSGKENQLKERISFLEGELKKYKEQTRRIESKLNKIQTSTIWKLTLPLRKIVKTTKTILGRN